MRSFPALALLAFSSPAFAAQASVRFCAKYDVEFIDADPSQGEDFLKDNDVDVPAYGVYMQVIRNSDGALMFDDFTSQTTGCSPYLTLSSTSYRMRLWTKSKINSDQIKVYSWSGSTWAQTFYYLESAYTPPSTGTITRNYTTPSTNYFNLLASTSWALKRSDGFTSNENFVFRLTIDPKDPLCDTEDPEPDCGGNAWHGSYVNLTRNAGAFERFVAIHEMGHAMGAFCNGGVSSVFSYGADCDNCWVEMEEDYDCKGSSAHQMHEKEFQSAAANEGWAHAYAAFAFNDETETDCSFNYYKPLDWDLDGTNETSNNNVNCEGAPMTGLANVDYLGDMCEDPLENRGTEYDWLRFWWDMYTNEDVSYPTTCDIWDGADPDDWNATDSGWTKNDPATRLRDSAEDLGFLTQWDALDNANGVHR